MHVPPLPSVGTTMPRGGWAVTTNWQEGRSPTPSKVSLRIPVSHARRTTPILNPSPIVRKVRTSRIMTLGILGMYARTSTITLENVRSICRMDSTITAVATSMVSRWVFRRMDMPWEWRGVYPQMPSLQQWQFLQPSLECTFTTWNTRSSSLRRRIFQTTFMSHLALGKKDTNALHTGYRLFYSLPMCHALY